MSEAVDCAPEPGTSSAELDEMWRRQLPYWHGVFAIVWSAAVVVTLLDDVGPHGRWPALLLLVGIAATYATLGVRGLGQDRRAAIAYHVVAVVPPAPPPRARPGHRDVDALLRPLPADVGDAAGPRGRPRDVPHTRGLRCTPVLGERVRVGQPWSHHRQLGHLPRALGRARGLHQPDRRRGRLPGPHHRRAARHPGPAGRGRARPRCPGRARADQPRDPRHPRPGLHERRHPHPGRGCRAGARRRRDRRASG